ncbi:MAG: twin-arginine translocation protein TatB subunit [Frankiales bacterium]|nr:twin-arginine translocation protein TatB subunit [Frankiales bacterium]
MGFDNLGIGELAVILVLGLFVLGPERLPKVAAEAGRTLRKVRLYVKGMTDDLKSELGPELGDVDLASLHPRTFVQKHLFSDEDLDPAVGRPVKRAGAPLAAGEPAPWDPDAT